MTERHELLRVIVGSQAHGLASPDSDTDYRRIYALPTEQMLSLGFRYAGSHWLEGTSEDHTAYEVGHFLTLALKCNPTILEVCLAPVISTTDWGDRLRALFPAFLDSEKAYAAFTGYAESQRKKFLDNKDGRAHKFASAYVRVMYQLCELLETRTFSVRIAETPIATLLRRCRAGDYTPGQIIDTCLALRRRADLALPRCHWPTQDLDHINRVLLDLRRAFWRGPDLPAPLHCSLCENPMDPRSAHLHQGSWIGDACCWDDRLRASE